MSMKLAYVMGLILLTLLAQMQTQRHGLISLNSLRLTLKVFCGRILRLLLSLLLRSRLLRRCYDGTYGELRSRTLN
ncbi:hypothetical protein QBC44DRAFT_157324 [Cladorrhinum sp. PSN332]|nr:hypothetical protein QBC44DRAFT_157324 [Cladorrhinum sp. PSN332]